MCSICGGTSINDTFQKILLASRDRGRDYGNVFLRGSSWICNHRAVPTTEIKNPEFNQPFGTDYKIVHNGVISNDKELGNPDGMIDSYILSKVLNFSSLAAFRDSLNRVKGSYAIAVLKPDGNFYLACNYKPLFYAYDSWGNFYFSSYKEHLCNLENITRLRPYSVYDSETKLTLCLEREITNNALVIASAGLDSTAVAAYACATHEKVTLLHFNYGCLAETPELKCIKQITDDLNNIYHNCDLYVMPISLDFMTNASTLLDGKENIAEGIQGSEYAHEWVPARNLIMMSLAVGFAEANEYSYIYLGTNLEEGGAYPDNEEQFIRDFNSCLYGAVQNGKYVEIRTPLGNLMKHEIIPFGLKYQAPFEHTWSCYKNGEQPCGECGPCFMRRTAFKRNGMEDPVEYSNNAKYYEQFDK